MGQLIQISEVVIDIANISIEVSMSEIEAQPF